MSKKSQQRAEKFFEAREWLLEHYRMPDNNVDFARLAECLLNLLGAIIVTHAKTADDMGANLTAITLDLANVVKSQIAQLTETNDTAH